MLGHSVSETCSWCGLRQHGSASLLLGCYERGPGKQSSTWCHTGVHQSQNTFVGNHRTFRSACTTTDPLVCFVFCMSPHDLNKPSNSRLATAATSLAPAPLSSHWPACSASSCVLSFPSLRCFWSINSAEVSSTFGSCHTVHYTT